MTPASWVAIASLILTEAPQLIALLQQLQSQGKTITTADELAAIGVDDAAFTAAYQRLFPGQTPPSA